VLGFANGGEFFPGRLFNSNLAGNVLFSGGIFGPEASIMAILSFVTLPMITWYLKKKKVIYSSY
jgi:hypothetical protein